MAIKLPKKFLKMGLKKGWAEYKKTNAYKTQKAAQLKRKAKKSGKKKKNPAKKKKSRSNPRGKKKNNPGGTRMAKKGKVKISILTAIGVASVQTQIYFSGINDGVADITPAKDQPNPMAAQLQMNQFLYTGFDRNGNFHLSNVLKGYGPPIAGAVGSKLMDRLGVNKMFRGMPFKL